MALSPVLSFDMASYFRNGFFIYICSVALTIGATVDTSRWHGRSIYFVVTDRFAQTDAVSDSSPACAGKEWCGGSLRGVQRKLGYIQSMGFDAIWITPVVKQVDWRDNWNGTSYHGYWAADFFAIDPHLGTEDDLISLKAECKRRGMLLMVDIVANHVGPIHSVRDVEKLGTHLNSPSGHQFHQLGRAASETFQSYIQHPTEMQDAGKCWPEYNFAHGCNYSVILDGWFGDLADLNQEDPETAAYLLRWIKLMTQKYDIDGFRLDTALYIPKGFLEKFQEAAGVYMIGEVVTYNISMHRSFTPPLTGLLNFPVTTQLNRIFSHSGSLVDLQQLLMQQNDAGYPDLNLLGNFVDNHDGERFLHNHSGDLSQLRNGLTWTMLYQGLPIIYYGTEQVDVSNQQDERTSMWPHYGVTDLGQLLAKLNKLRKDYGLAHGGPESTKSAVVVSASSDSFVFVRGDLLAMVTNAGANHSVRVCVALSSLPGKWLAACSSKSVEAVLGTSPAACQKEQLCIETKEGQPSAYALVDVGGVVV